MSSVYVRKRRESKYEPIIHAETLRDELIEFAKREYGFSIIRRSNYHTQAPRMHSKMVESCKRDGLPQGLLSLLFFRTIYIFYYGMVNVQTHKSHIVVDENLLCTYKQ